jgi:hypothetical protein
VGDAVAPAFARVEAAVVGQGRQVRRRRPDELGALFVREERLDAVGARDLGERERGERLAKPLPSASGRRRGSRSCGSTARSPASAPWREPVNGVEGDPVAQLRVGRGEAVEQGERERLARVVVGDLPFDLLRICSASFVVVPGGQAALASRRARRQSTATARR